MSEHINLENGRFKDDEIEESEHLVENRSNLNGMAKIFHSSYKTFGSEDTYRVAEKDTYTFAIDEKINIKRDFVRCWDDGQTDISHEVYDTARDILNIASKLFGGSGR